MASHESEQQAEQFAAWVREHSLAVHGYLLGMTRRADAADDLLQEVFRRAWQARASYRDNGHARAYLLKIADRLACDRHRKARPEITLDGEEWKKREPPSRDDDPSVALDRREKTAQLQEAMRGLSPMQRRVLLLRFFGQMSFAEIAAEIGCPLSTALSHCRRALETLRTLLVEESKK
ncbi:MAG: RNA polymerase sigma factor [Pirellulales bacterium]|nr:RNA polymerase sigma factor [Pirellulales bacterium]